MKRILNHSLFLLTLIFLLPCCVHADEFHRGKVSDFELLDCDGHAHRLSDYSECNLVVLAFLGTECPLAKLYGKRLQDLQDEFSQKELKLIAINSNDQDSLGEMRKYLDDLAVSFPFLKDTHHAVADQVGATRTPEVFLLDKHRNIRFQGRIDDQYGIGKSRRAPRQMFLKEAINELLAGSQVSQPKVDAVGCLLGRSKALADEGKITYTNQIVRVFQNRCVTCHRDGQIGPFSMTHYDEVASWADMIDEVVQEGRMPPWHADPSVGSFRNDRHLSDEEKSLIHSWVVAGTTQGDAKDLPIPRKFLDGWQLSDKPDQIIAMRDTPFQVPAEGVVDYQYFVVDPGFSEDKFVKACEVVPGNRKVVHHILIFALPPGKAVLGIDDDGFLFAYVPGLMAQQLPAGMAKRIPAGSKLLFQVHYTPVGTPEEDLSSVGLVFADPDEITHEVFTAGASNKRFSIPPGDANHRVVAESRPLPVDSELMSMSPHMHFRGKSFRYEAVLPNGERHPLIDVPRYDFNWQTNYELTERMKLPQGTVIRCVATFDNSEDNPANPNAEATVRWGEQTWQEMMIGYFTVATPISANRGGLNPFERQKVISQVDRIVFHRLDQNRDGKVIVGEVDPALWAFGKLAGIDTDDNDQMSNEELHAWLQKMDNPLSLLDNPLIQQIPEVSRLIKRMEGKQ